MSLQCSDQQIADQSTTFTPSPKRLHIKKANSGIERDKVKRLLHFLERKLTVMCFLLQTFSQVNLKIWLKLNETAWWECYSSAYV